MLRLEYSLEEASAIIESFSNNWDNVRDHLNQVARLPAYRYDMCEVFFSRLIFTNVDLYVSVPFS